MPASGSRGKTVSNIGVIGPQFGPLHFLAHESLMPCECALRAVLFRENTGGRLGPLADWAALAASLANTCALRVVTHVGELPAERVCSHVNIAEELGPFRGVEAAFFGLPRGVVFFGGIFEMR